MNMRCLANSAQTPARYSLPGPPLPARPSAFHLLGKRHGSAQPCRAVPETSLDLPVQVPVPVTVESPATTDLIGGAPGGEGLLNDLGGAASEATAEVLERASSLTSDVTKAAGDLTTDVTRAASGLTSDLTQKASGVTSNIVTGVKGATSQLSSGTSSALDTINRQLAEQTKSATEAYTSIRDRVQDVVSSSTEALQSTSSQVTQAVGDNLEEAARQVQQTFTTVETEVGETVDQALAQLPAPVRDALGVLGGLLRSVGNQAQSHPLTSTAVVVAVVGTLAWKSYQDKYGGYAGELEPEDVRELLLEENALLIDIRDEEERQEEGLPELKLAARFKAVVFPPAMPFSGALARVVKNPEQLAYEMAAVYMTGLPQVSSPMTRMVVMNSRGDDQARMVARALRSIGMPLPYIMKGGYKGWVERGMPTVSGMVEYDDSAAAFITDEIEYVAENVTRAVEPLKQPGVAVPLIAGIGAGSYALYNWHQTLEYIGVYGVLLTVVKKLLEYDSPGELLDDVGEGLEKVQKTVSSFTTTRRVGPTAEQRQLAAATAASVAASSAGGAEAQEEEPLGYEGASEENKAEVSSERAELIASALARANASLNAQEKAEDRREQEGGGAQEGGAIST